MPPFTNINDVKHFKNYQQPTTLPVTNKSFTNHQQNKFNSRLLRDKLQSGLCIGYKTTSNSHVITHIAEKSADSNKPLYMGFLNQEKIFDSVKSSVDVKELTRLDKYKPYVNSTTKATIIQLMKVFAMVAMPPQLFRACI